MNDVIIIDMNTEKRVDIDDLTDLGVGQAIFDCDHLKSKLRDKHRELMDSPA